MKAFIFGLSLMGLIVVGSTLKADTQKADAADQEVKALVQQATGGDENVPVFKADKTPVEAKEKSKTGPLLWLRVVGSLVLVIFLFGGGIYLFKKLPNTNRLAAKAKMIQVLSQHYLGAKKSVAVIRVAGETVLVGITDNNINLIKTLSLLDDDLPGDPALKNKKFNQALSQKIKDDSEEFSMRRLKGIFKA